MRPGVWKELQFEETSDGRSQLHEDRGGLKYEEPQLGGRTEEGEAFSVLDRETKIKMSDL